MNDETPKHQVRAETLGERKDRHRARVNRIMDGLKAGTFSEGQVRNLLAGMLTIADLKGSEDKIMNIPTRKEFEKKVQQLVDEGVQFGFIIADIDHFKKYNDDYGHSTGDVVLGLVGSVLKETVREDDYLARWGGEEVGIIGIFKDEQELLEVCERLRTKVAENKGFIVGFNKVPGVTISLGAGIFKGGSFEEFFNKVDGMLNEAKQNGRNQSKILVENNV